MGRYLYIVMGLAVMGCGIAGLQGSLSLQGMGAALILSGLVLGGQGLTRWKASSRPALDFRGEEELEEERAELLQESYQKAVADCAYIEEARRRIGDVDLSRQLGKMQQVAGNMLRYLEKNPKKIPQAQRFIDYYQDRAVRLVKEYQELEQTELRTGQVQAMKARMKEALSGLDEAYEEQFERLLRDQFIDLDAEIKVMEQTMNSEGIQRSAELPEEKPPGNAPGLEGMLNRLQSSITVKRRGRHPGGHGHCRRMEKGMESFSIIPEERRGDVLLTKVIQSGLAIFLGSFGAHKFYQGKTWQGVLYCAFFWTMLPGLIGFFEGLRYMCMKMDDFYTEYYMKRVN